MRTLLFLFGIWLTTGLVAQNNLVKWTTLNTGTTKDIKDIYFHTPNIGYIVGEDYLFKKTTDGGVTWKDLTPPNIGERPANNGMIVGIGYHSAFSFGQLDSGLYLTWEQGFSGVSTSDDGATYRPFSYVHANQFCVIDGFEVLPHNRGNGYVQLFTYGQSCSGNAVYTNYYDGPFAINVADSSVTPQAGYFTTVAADSLATIFGHNHGYLLRYPNVTAQPDSIHLDRFGVTAVDYAKNGVWFAATASGINNMYRSLDGGKTFKQDSTFPRTFHYPEINDLSFISKDRGIAAATSNGRNGAIIVKDSSNWFFINATEPLHVAQLFSNGVAYVAGENGLLMKSGKTGPIDAIATYEEMEFQVYPNPAQNQIQLTAAHPQQIDGILLQDHLGQVVLPYQSFQSQLDVSELAAGVYFLQVLSDERRFSKKIIIH